MITLEIAPGYGQVLDHLEYSILSFTLNKTTYKKFKFKKENKINSFIRTNFRHYLHWG